MSLQKKSKTSRWLAMELIHLSLEFLWNDISFLVVLSLASIASAFSH